MIGFRTLFASATALLLASGVMAQTTFTEVEPNETKATATVANPMAPGDMLTGVTTGTVTTAGAITSLDTWRVKMTPVAAGIYRYRLVVTSDTVGHVISIRGLTQTGGIPNAGTDAAFQTSVTTSNPPRFVQWYGFGQEEELYIRITGAAATTSAYVATLEREAVTPIDMIGTVVPGDVSVVPDAATSTAFDTDWWVYDNSFNAIPGFGHDDADTTAVTRSHVPGNYYLAAGIYNSANNLGSNAPEDTFRTGIVLDFPGAYASSSTSTSTTNITYNVTSAAGTVSATGNRTGQFDVVWFRYIVAASENPVGSGVATPNGGPNDGTANIHFGVTVIGGINPPSTNLAVAIDLSGIGGPANATMFDDGAHNDGAAGDLVFGLDYTIPNGAATGTFIIPFGVADGQGRSSAGAINGFRVVGPPTITHDFGDMSTPRVETQIFDLAPAEVKWFRFSLSQPADAGLGTFLDIDNENSGCVDLELGVYRADGTLVVSDDDDGSSVQSQISFGAGGRPAVNTCTAASAAYNGRDGTLAVGTYFIAAVRFNATFAADFTVTTTDATGATGYNLNIRSRVDPIPPTVTGGTVTALLDGAAVDAVVTATIVPGAFPTSTGLSVVVNASQFGGSATLAMLDDGIFPDAAPGDNIYSASVNIASNTPGNQYLLPVTATDAESRTGNGNITVNVATILFDFGDMTSPPRALSQVFDVAAGQTAWFKFSLSQPADAGLGTFLDIDTENSGCQDTEVGVYRTDGTLRLSDDNDGSSNHSQLSFGTGGRPLVNTCTANSVAYNGRDGVLDAGTYYVAVSQFNAVFTAGFNVTTTGTAGLTAASINIRSFTDPIAPTGTGVAAPATAANDGASSTVFRVTVTPGSFPPSTGLAVTIDASQIGGSNALVALDDGIDPDLVPGDNIFSVRYTIPVAQTAGAVTLPFTITDAESRTGSGNINNFSVVDAVGACCQATGCTFILRTDCLAAGGSFLGHNVRCTSGDGFDITTTGGAFEDISATSTVIPLTDDSNANIPIGFTFRFYGADYTDCFVGSNGYVTFGAGYNTLGNVVLPAAGVPNNALYGLWDDLNPATGGSVSYEVRGTAGTDLRLIVQWTGVPQFNNTDSNTFQIVIFEDGHAEYRYGAITAFVAGDVTIGAENADGTEADSYDVTLLGTGNVSLHLARRAGQDNCGSNCPQDFNNDGDVNGDDLADYINCFFSIPPCADADFNNDGDTNGDDLGDYINAFFGPGC